MRRLDQAVGGGGGLGTAAVRALLESCAKALARHFGARDVAGLA